MLKLLQCQSLYVADSKYGYYLQPCNKNATECGPDLSMTACQVDNNTPPNKYGIGKVDGNTAESSDTNNFTLKNTFGTNTDTRTSLLTIVCSSKQDEFIFEKEDPTNTYHFTLNTRFACPSSKSSSGLSVGSILVILFFVFILVYLIGGVLFLKYVRKAQGAEVIPNVEFWKELPSLIKDGVLFTCRGCKAETTYEKI
ncbi:uncharacterized protein LOC131944860 isoform X2 [Physella acuta]|uniref:uncharacterized protein LOC131944860 isoform X2 n=1 Tax=Physella acuta TaxID=109671 RepID=UPI0027DCB188|nr:uncharacterized protein LOC131944860 isoform X2 [Physella acuta]